MKILFITSSAINGGAQKHIRDMFKFLTRAGNDVFIASPAGWLIDELNEYNDRVLVLKTLKGLKPLKQFINIIKPDVVNTFILSGGVLGTIAWRKMRYGRLFVTVNNPVIYDGISSFRRVVFPFLYRWMSRSATAFLVKSDTVRDEVEKVIRKKRPVLSIKNGIDFDVFNNSSQYDDIRSEMVIKQSDTVITNVAVLDSRKGQRYLIDAVKTIHNMKKDTHLLLVGSGADEEKLKSYVTNIDADEYIHFLGRRSDINTILANSDIFVLSSLHEGLPNALMEAMAMGLPCVATNVGGVSQLITDRENGIIINAKSVDSIIDGIDFYTSNMDRAKEIGKCASQYIYKEYKQTAVAEELTEIYRLC